MRTPPYARLARSAVSALAGSCAALGEQGGEALRAAGRRCAEEVVDPGAGSRPSRRFWSDLDDEVRRAGLGSLAYEPVCARTGAVAWRDSPEACDPPDPRDSPEEPDAPEAEPAPDTPRCHFATGFLGAALSRVAQRPVAVVEVRCVARGGGATRADPGADFGGACWFLFGSPAALEEVATARHASRS